MFDQTIDRAGTTSSRPFQNVEWRLLADGLEHKTSGYVIERDLIGMRRGDLWEWPLHLAEKSWCSPRSFREAFLAALDAFGVVPDAALSRSFAVGFGRIAGAGSKAGTDEFIALGELVRPKPPVAARKRGSAAEGRAPARRNGLPVPQRVGEAARQRVTL